MRNQKQEIATIKERTLTIKLSDADVMRVCKKAGAHNITVAQMVESYLQDLVHGTYTNGSDEREYANAYFERCGYSWMTDNTFTRYLIEWGFINDYMDNIEAENDLKADIAIYEDIEEPTADDLQELEALKEDLEEVQGYILDYYREYSAESKESETEPLEEAQSGVLKWYEEYKTLKGEADE